MLEGVMGCVYVWETVEQKLRQNFNTHQFSVTLNRTFFPAIQYLMQPQSSTSMIGRIWKRCGLLFKHICDMRYTAVVEP